MEAVKSTRHAPVCPACPPTAFYGEHVHVQEHRQKVEQCWYQGHPDNIAIRGFGELRHDKRNRTMIGGIICPPVDAASIPALFGLVPQLFHHGNGDEPVVTVFAIALPEIEPWPQRQ